MFKSFFLAAAVLFSICASAQQFIISGYVKDSKGGQPLPGATVVLQEANKNAVADEFGFFNIKNVSAGSHDVVIKYLGFSDKHETLDVQANVSVNFLLEESAVITDEVVIYSTRATDKTPTTFTTLNKQAIQKQNFGQDLPFVLNWTPSVVTTSDAGAGVGYTGIRIRGSDATRVNVTINGIPYNDGESLGTFWVDVPDIASSSQSVQIQRGVGTSTNGAGAFGASINLQTNTRNDAPYAEVINSAGSFNTRRHTLSFGSGLLDNHWVVDGRISKIVSDGFIDRASSDLQSYYFSAGFYAGNTMIKAITFGGKERTYQSWYGVPESRLNNNVEAMNMTAINEGWNDTQLQNLLTSGSRTFNPYTYQNQVDDYRQDHYQLHLSQRFSSSLNGNVALHYTPGKGYYEEYRNNDSFSKYGLSDVVIGDSIISSSDLVRRRWLDNDFYGFTYALNYETTKLTSTFGGGWNRYDGDHYGEIVWAQVSNTPINHRYYFNNGDKRDFNTFIKTNYQFTEKLNGYIDLQYRRVTYKTSGIESKQNTFNISADYNFFNPKVGLVYALRSNEQLYASYGVGNHEPVRDDFVDAFAGTQPKHENLQNVEAGYRLVQNRFTLNVNYYLMNYKNQLVLTGKINDVGASLRTNVDNSYRTGVEVEGTVKISDQLIWNANFTVSKNKIKKFNEVLYDYGANFDEYNEVTNSYKDTDISFSPNVIAGSSLSFRPWRVFEVALLSKYVGRQYLDNTQNNSRSIDAYFVNDLRLSYTINPTFMKQIGLSLLVNNITNKKYESNGYTWGYLAGPGAYRENYYYPQAGTNFLAMVTLKF